MKALFMTLTAPLWLPLLFTAASASIAIGITMVVMGAALRSGRDKDPWDVPSEHS